MTIRCISCTNLDLRSAPVMAAQGFGRCLVAPRSEYWSVTMERECAKFVAATQAMEAERVAWLKRKVKQVRSA